MGTLSDLIKEAKENSHFGRNLAIGAGAAGLLGVGALALASKGKIRGGGGGGGGGAVRSAVRAAKAEAPASKTAVNYGSRGDPETEKLLEYYKTHDFFNPTATKPAAGGGALRSAVKAVKAEAPAAPAAPVMQHAAPKSLEQHSSFAANAPNVFNSEANASKRLLMEKFDNTVTKELDIAERKALNAFHSHNVPPEEGIADLKAIFEKQRAHAKTLGFSDSDIASIQKDHDFTLRIMRDSAKKMRIT
jgi:hypothetical protein